MKLDLATFTPGQPPLVRAARRRLVKALREVTEARRSSRPKTGDCYEAAVVYLMANGGLSSVVPAKKKGLLLVHGEVTGQGPPPPAGVGGVQYGHAWIEDGDTVIDTSNGGHRVLPKIVYYALGRIDKNKNVHRYTVEQVRKKLIETRVYGPWDLRTSTGL